MLYSNKKCLIKKFMCFQYRQRKQLPVCIDPTAYPSIKAKKKNTGRYPANGNNEMEILLQTDHPKRNKKRNRSNLSNNTPAEISKVINL